MNYVGEDTGRTVQLDPSIFSVTPNEHAIYLAVKHTMANKRQGTHKTKERAEISGSTRKIKKQKGTGTARAGSIKSPLFRGGGRAFGPQPRRYHTKLNKKLKRLARNSVLSHRAMERCMTILAPFQLAAPKTKYYFNILKDLRINDKKTLLILPTMDANMMLASRNLPYAKVVTAMQLNTYDLLYAQHLIFSEQALAGLVNHSNT